MPAHIVDEDGESVANMRQSVLPPESFSFLVEVTTLYSNDVLLILQAFRTSYSMITLLQILIKSSIVFW